METHSATMLPLFLISVLAFLVPILTTLFSEKTKFHIPIVVGEILCGIIIGKSCLNLISDTSSIPWLNFLYLFGFTYLMFLSGLEVDLNSIFECEHRKPDSKTGSSPLILGFWYFGLTLILAYGISYYLWLNEYIYNPIMMTLILSTTSVSIVVPILKEKILTKTDYGQTILLSALVADFLTMTLITLFVALNTTTKPTHSFLLIFLLIALVVLIYRLHVLKIFDTLIEKLLLIKPFFDKLSHQTSQIKVRGAIALMVVFIAASQLMGFEVILGAFIAGILTTMILGGEKTDQLEMKLDAIGYGFFIPIFFIGVGINLDLGVFFASSGAWKLLVILIVSAFIIKVLPSFIFRFKFSFKKSIGAGFLLASRLSLIIAASTIGLKEGFISEEINATIIMLAVVSCIISPILFNKIALKSKD